jgi:prepilin-type N-terminal cleavage/methylation domain-containing protein
VKGRDKAFTVVELLTVITIIAILVGVLLPSLTKVKTMVRETQQKVQINTISLAIGAFKNDFGYYPPSSPRDNRQTAERYIGAQKLTEALLGQDLLGFHSESGFYRDGYDDSSPPVDLYPDDLDGSTQAGELNLQQRRGPYLEGGTEYAYRLIDVAYNNVVEQLDGDRYIFCDVFTRKRINVTIQGGNIVQYNIKVGTPILYYRANTASRVFDTGPFQDRIYNGEDNVELIRLGKIESGENHTLVTNDGVNGQGGLYFYDEDYRIVNPKASNQNMNWPYRPDTYLLISAGADGEYGTRDDITNFK